MKPTILVVTTVHWPDDTRIRERLIRTLSSDFDVQYASRTPGPSDRSDLHSIELRGGRFARFLRAMRLGLFGTWDLMVIHDPELLPVAVASRLRRRPVVFDVHENVPATALTRDWVPNLLRRPFAAALRMVLRVAECVLAITLAEAGYASLFRKEHAVFPNYPDTSAYPTPVEGRREVVYLGDVTVERGARVLTDACGAIGVPLRFVGRFAPELHDELSREGVLFHGQLPNPDALELVRHGGVAVSPLLDTPNYRHSAPTKILEYLALGLPVVATDLPGTRKLTEGLDAVQLVPPGNSGLLSAAIERSLAPGARLIASEQADTIKRAFRWPADDVSKFYRSLV